MPGPLIRTKFLSATGTGTIASAPGATLAFVNVGTGAASATITIYDDVAATSGREICTIDCSTAGNGGWFMTVASKGLYYNLSGGNAKVSIGYV